MTYLRITLSPLKACETSPAFSLDSYLPNFKIFFMFTEQISDIEGGKFIEDRNVMCYIACIYTMTQVVSTNLFLFGSRSFAGMKTVHNYTHVPTYSEILMFILNW